MTPLSRKSIVILKSVAVKHTKQRAASVSYLGSGIVEEENDSSFWPAFSGEEGHVTHHCHC